MTAGRLSVPANAVPRLPIRGQLLAMGMLAAIGGVTFLPFLAAGNRQPIAQLIPFAIVVTLVATIAAWPGLRCADATGLPMPLLRRLDGSSAGQIPRSAIGVTLASSIGLGPGRPAPPASRRGTGTSRLDRGASIVGNFRRWPSGDRAASRRHEHCGLARAWTPSAGHCGRRGAPRRLPSRWWRARSTGTPHRPHRCRQRSNWFGPRLDLRRIRLRVRHARPRRRACHYRVRQLTPTLVLAAMRVRPP